MDAQLLRPATRRFRHWQHARFACREQDTSLGIGLPAKECKDNGSCGLQWQTQSEQHTAPHCGLAQLQHTLICPYVGGLSDPGSFVNENSLWLLLNVCCSVAYVVLLFSRAANAPLQARSASSTAASPIARIQVEQEEQEAECTETGLRGSTLAEPSVAR